MVVSVISSFGSRLDLDTSVATSASGEPIPEEDESTKICSTAVIAILGSDVEAGSGTLVITTK